ncbi:MAG: hypothetical protein HKN76_09690, partial [Saprospiraceae bacterium]|nr:hypothetical protein [Saprospiraceae bacterium]
MKKPDLNVENWQKIFNVKNTKGPCKRRYLLMILILCSNAVALLAQIENASFESEAIDGERQIVTKLDGWEITKGNIEIISSSVFAAVEGKQVLDLNGDQPGSIKQTVRGLENNEDYTLKFEYADQKGRIRDPISLLASAEVIINEINVATLRNISPAPNYIGGIGFAFRSTATGTATIEFVSTTSGDMGLVIDNLRIEEGLPLAPPLNNQLVNGSFEMAVDNESGNPHLFGEQLPGWLIMRENIDLIAIDRYGTPDGKWVIDLGGHGPGGIAQTVSHLVPGAEYRLSMLYARHQWWNEEDPLTGQIFLNDELVLSLSRNLWAKAPRWEKATFDFIAPADGKVKLSLFSTAYKVGGGILYDDIRIEKISDIIKTKRIPVLIIDGFSNHQWDTNTVYLQKILESSGKFDVSVSTCPKQDPDKSTWENWNPDFNSYPVVIQT